MAQGGGGKMKKINNLEVFNSTWSQKIMKIVEVDKHVKQDLSQSLTDMRKIMQMAGIDDTEKFQQIKNLYVSMKQKRTFKNFPEQYKAEFAILLQEEEKPMAETKSKKDERQYAQDTNESVDAGHAPISNKSELSPNPQQSSFSPIQSHKQLGGEGSQETKTLKMQIDQLNSQLKAEMEKGKKRETELDESKKELDTKEEELTDFASRFEMLRKENQKLEHEVSVKQKLEHELSEKQQRINTMEKQLEVNHTEQFNLQSQLKRQTGEYIGMQEKLKEALENNTKLTKEKKHLEKKHETHMATMYETMADEKRKHDSEMQKLTKDRDDIRDRFSKLAGAKLSDQNADIADLSDPNRAMKLSERFGQLYDDEWTNAFETLTEKKIGLSLKEAINLLLRLLQDCWSFCNTLLTTQMESLHNVFLHPAQNMAKIDPRKNVGGLKDRPRIGSKEEKTLRDVRRMIGVGPSVIEEVKQSLLSEVKSLSKEKTGYDKKHIDACAPYIQRCAEVCWLMAVHDPPLYMKMDVKPGEKLDPNVYSVYSSSGNTIDFLVWPPLLNGKEGGLLAKGVAEPQKIVGKKK